MPTNLTNLNFRSQSAGKQPDESFRYCLYQQFSSSQQIVFFFENGFCSWCLNHGQDASVQFDLTPFSNSRFW